MAEKCLRSIPEAHVSVGRTDGPALAIILSLGILLGRCTMYQYVCLCQMLLNDILNHII